MPMNANCTGLVKHWHDSRSAVNLTWKLEIDVVCFAAGVLFVMWHVVRQLCTAAFRRLRTGQPVSKIIGQCMRRRRALLVPLLPFAKTQDHQQEHRQALTSKFLQSIRAACKQEGPTFANYFRYLFVCCITFMILFMTSLLISAVMATAVGSTDEDHKWKENDIVARVLIHRPMNGERMVKTTLVLVIVNGIIFLIATVILERWCEEPVVAEDVRRTIWVHGLPVKDQRLNPFVTQPFKLTSDELQRVGTDLAAAFNEELSKRGGIETNDEGVWVVDEWDAQLPRGTKCHPTLKLRVGNEIGAKGIYSASDGTAIFVKKVAAASRIDKVWVTPVVDKWRSIAEKLQHTLCQQLAYKEWALRHYGNDPAELAWRGIYEKLGDKCDQKVQRLESELLTLRLNRLRMCGNAFVRFRKPRDCVLLMGNPPRWWDCSTWMCWWKTLKFGHVPFTSVTLEYEPAPHPDDIVWANMHLPRLRNELPFWFFALILAAVTLAIVTPINVPQVVQVLRQLLFRGGHGDGESDRSETKSYDQFASLLLLFINRALLPFPIQWIVFACKFRRKTEAELREMHLNFWLLIIHAWIAPLVGVAFLQHTPFDLAALPSISCIALHVLFAPKRLFLSYLLDVTFLTNLYGLLCGHLFRFASQIKRRVMATHTFDQRKCREPRQYPFGYEYAWTLSVVTLGLGISASVPSALMIVAMYFCIKLIVEWPNIRSKVYEPARPQEEVFTTNVVFYMRLILSAWWINAGVELGALCTFQGCSREVELWLFPACIVLMGLACTVLLLSIFHVWYKQALRRFIPGRLQVVDDTEEEEGLDYTRSWSMEPYFGESWATKPILAESPEPNMADSPEPNPEPLSHRSKSPCAISPHWDARPAFQSSGVEATVDLVRRRPDLEGAVRHALQHGTHDGFSEERLLRVTRSSSCPQITCTATATVAASAAAVLPSWSAVLPDTS